MIYKPDYFDLEELVCRDVFDKYGDMAWQFFDQKALITIDTLRQRIGKPVWINNWKEGGKLDERGFRCIQCQEVQKAIKSGRLYVSPHMTGQGFDLDVEGLVAEEVRQWILKNKQWFPHPVRLEEGVSWVHIDTRNWEYNTGRNADSERVYLFKAA